MIIVEGLDNAGKSRLAQKLSDDFGLPVVRRAGPGPLDDMLRRVTELFMSTEMEIHDRCSILSEAVYGSVLRGGSIFREKNWEYLWLLLWKHPMIIYCRPPAEQIFNFGVREQMDGVKDSKIELLTLYDDLMEVVDFMTTDHNNFFIYDWTEPGHYEQLSRVIRRYIVNRKLELTKFKLAATHYKHLIGVNKDERH